MVDKNVALMALALSDSLAIAGIVYTPRPASWFSIYGKKIRSLPKRSPLCYLLSSNVTESHYRRIYYFTFGSSAIFLTYIMVLQLRR